MLEPVVVQLEFLLVSCVLFNGVVLSAAGFQAERKISRSDAVSDGRSFGPLVKTRAFGMTQRCYVGWAG